MQLLACYGQAGFGETRGYSRRSRSILLELALPRLL